MARVMVEGCALPLVRRYGKSEWLAAKQESILTQRAQRKLKPQSSRSFTVKSGSKATLPRGVMAGAGPQSLSVILCAGHNRRQGGVLCRAKPRNWSAR